MLLRWSNENNGIDRTCGLCERNVECILQVSISPSWSFVLLVDIWFFDFSNYQLNAQFFYFSTIYMLHYATQHVSSSTLLIIRRTNCITTASGIVTLRKQPYSMRVESGLQSALNRHTVRLLTDGDDTRGCGDTISPPEDEQRAARKMLRIVV